MYANHIKFLTKLGSEVPGLLKFSRFLSNEFTKGKEKWDLVSSVCLERRPILSSPSTDLESKFQKVLMDIEFENSLKSDHEVRSEKERKLAELLQKGELDLDTDVSLKQSAQDLEDAYNDEYSKFKCAERITEADLKHDLQALNRSLDKYLILILNQKIGNEYVWSLPQGVRGNGETMRQTAERVLMKMCGNDINAKFLGNAPCGFYKYKYPLSVRSKSPDSPVGAKVFFFKAWHHGGQVVCNKENVKNYMWLSPEELCKNLPDEYYKSVSQFLIT